MGCAAKQAKQATEKDVLAAVKLLRKSASRYQRIKAAKEQVISAVDALERAGDEPFAKWGPLDQLCTAIRALRDARK